MGGRTQLFDLQVAVTLHVPVEVENVAAELVAWRIGVLPGGPRPAVGGDGLQTAERAVSLAWPSAGRSIAARMAMIAMTTSSSMSVNGDLPLLRGFIVRSPLVLLQ